ncbi:MAG: T9SS type A sorting domain-containing protein [Flavobacteriales bacterium]|nr:T9SS type A sorting domain-containing protein [Bacteroidota bacterium]MCB9241190.1 T9SS type A sorting domain-containing protein [Flavobacteriales bacterium]
MKQVLLLLLGSFISISSTPGQSITWDDPKVVTTVSGVGSARPKIGVVDGGRPIVMWGRQTNREVYFCRWEDTAFSTPLNILPKGVTAFATEWAGPSLASKGDTIFVAFKSQPEMDGFVYVVRSVDGGLNFSDTIRVSPHNRSRFPEVSVGPGGHPAVTYMNFDENWLEPAYVVRVSNDAGNSFANPRSASGAAPGEVCDCCPGFILFDSDGLEVLFRNNDSDIRDIWYSHSSDQGSSYDQVTHIDPNNWKIGGCPSTGPEAVAFADSLYVTWRSNASGSTKINLASVSRLDGGRGTYREFPNSTSLLQDYPKVAKGDDFLMVVYQESQGNTSTIQGVWGNPDDVFKGSIAPVTLSLEGSIRQQTPDVVIDQHDIHLAWQDASKNRVIYRHGVINLSTSNDVHKPNTRVWPNPVTDLIHVAYHPDNTPKAVELIELSTGRMVEVQPNLEDNAVVLDVNHQPEGVYLLRILGEYSVEYKRIAVVR